MNDVYQHLYCDALTINGCTSGQQIGTSLVYLAHPHTGSDGQEYVWWGLLWGKATAHKCDVVTANSQMYKLKGRLSGLGKHECSCAEWTLQGTGRHVPGVRLGRFRQLDLKVLNCRYVVYVYCLSM